MKIATWNLDHASNSSRPIESQIEKIKSIDANIWVLTETCEQVDLTKDGYQCVTPHNNKYGKYWSTIWVRNDWAIKQQIDCYDNETAVCALIETPGRDVIVYGTIITWRDDPGNVPNVKSPSWAEHMKSIVAHGADWRLIQKNNSGVPFVVAGDFNQTRDGSPRTYGTKACRELLSAELTRSHLKCETTENFGNTGKLKDDPKKGWPRNNIDHICISDKAFQVKYVGAWDHFTEAGKYLSDHNGVFVELEYA